MFNSGLLPGAAYREFLRQLKSECKDDLEFHKRFSDWSQAPRRKDFNDIYTNFKKERFGTTSLSDMLCINQFETSPFPPGRPREFELFEI